MFGVRRASIRHEMQENHSTIYIGLLYCYQEFDPDYNSIDSRILAR